MDRSKVARTSSLKALQAIKENSLVGRNAAKLKKVEMETGGVKRSFSPSALNPPLPKRNALGNITNVNSSAPSEAFKSVPSSKPEVTGKCKVIIEEEIEEEEEEEEEELLPRRSKRLSKKSNSPPSVESLMCTETLESTSMSDVQQVLQATSLSDKDDGEWKDIDEAEAHDPLFSSEYATDIYSYMKEREEHFMVGPYLDHQPLINSSMRTILIDWLVEVQENFELFHETLYLSVKIVDRYLEQKEVRKEYLQLVGATSMLIAAKFEELSPPLVDDFIYLCDDAYQHDELLTMERNILATLDYDINAPVAYRFLRRLARAAGADMETHTLARYICESTLQEYDFVSDRPSHLASAAMYLALRMRKLGQWTPTLQHYSGYQAIDLLPLVQRLNDLISKPVTNTATVRSKYSHEVFQKVALTSPLSDVYEDYHICFPEEDDDTALT